MSLESYRSHRSRLSRSTPTNHDDSYRSGRMSRGMSRDESFRSRGTKESAVSRGTKESRGTKGTATSRGTKSTAASRGTKESSRGTKDMDSSQRSGMNRGGNKKKDIAATRQAKLKEAAAARRQRAAAAAAKKRSASVPTRKGSKSPTVESNTPRKKRVVKKAATPPPAKVEESKGGSGWAKVKTSFPVAPVNTAEPNNESDNPLDDIPTDRTPIKRLIKMLNDDEPSLTVLKLDGRKKIKPEDWESLFEALEENTTITHLSISRCDIEDSMAVSLVLALVENETIVELRLNGNKGITDDTGKGFIKVLRQSNSTLKKLELLRCKVTKKSTNELNKILQERDDQKKKDKMQAEREAKIKALLAFSASDAVAVPDVVEDEADASMSVASSSPSKTSSKRSGKKGGKKKKGADRLADSKTSLMSSGRAGSRARGNTRAGRGGSMRTSTMRASMTAAQMAQLGGDIANVGADASKIKDQRKMRGECEVCGQKCFNKTMFKSTPLTVPGAVYEGRCLKCNPM